MPYVIYDNDTTKLITRKIASKEGRTYYPTHKHATRNATAMAKTGQISLQNITVCDLDYYCANIEKNGRS